MNTGRSETEWRVGDTNYGTRKKKYKKEEKIEKKTRLGTAGTEYKINDKPLQSARPTHGYLCTMPIPGCKIVKSETGCRLGRTKGKKKGVSLVGQLWETCLIAVTGSGNLSVAVSNDNVHCESVPLLYCRRSSPPRMLNSGISLMLRQLSHPDKIHLKTPVLVSRGWTRI